jgi:hypothetical protein
MEIFAKKYLAKRIGKKLQVFTFTRTALSMLEKSKTLLLKNGNFQKLGN